MSFDRTTILKSPGRITFDSASIFSRTPISVALITEYFTVGTDAYGIVGRRVQARRIEVTCEPSMWSDLTKLFPYASSAVGSAIFGATDKPLVITPIDGAPLTLANAAVTQLPGITLSHGKPILRPMKFTALCANSGNPATAADWFSFGTPASGVALTGFDLTKVYNTRYSLGWNSGTYRSEEGFGIDFELGLAPDVVDGEGIVNYRITELGASLKFRPTGKTEAEYAALLGWDKAPGGQPTQSDAVITGEGSGSPIVTLNQTQVMGGSAEYGADITRTGEIELATTREVSAGALAPLWVFTAAA